MKYRLEQAPTANFADETVSQLGAASSQRPNLSSPNRQIVAGSGPHLTEETQALLCLRIRASALMFLIGFGVFLVRHVAGVLMGEPLLPMLLGLHVLVVVVMSLFAAPWWWRESLSIKKLRRSELAVFGLPASFFLLLQYYANLDDPGRSVRPAQLPFWLLQIFTYGMFIPNTWRRAAIVIGAMALAPILLNAAMMWVYPQVAGAMTALRNMEHGFVLLVAAVAAVVGTRLINNLRREVFEARQLGQYRLIKKLGAGAMGEVYLAEHRMLKRPCAIKLIHPDRAGDPRILARFEREVQSTAQLSHWNTIEIFDYGRTDDGTFFYVMEYLPGLSLDDLLKRRGPLPAARVIHLLRQTCDGLREAHAAGLIHRDIKPANVFASQRGGLYDVVKLLDFGLVKLVNENPSARLSQEGGISGTPLYMSPEQARGQVDLDARSDIYSLGALAYVLLTGRPPFDGVNSMDVMIAHVRDEVVRPSQYCADLPADLEDVVLRCLAKRPADRFPDVESLEQALAQCAAADQWTQRRAARWWQENDQTVETARQVGVMATV
jgi:serine/threonine-protein kinase